MDDSKNTNAEPILDEEQNQDLEEQDFIEGVDEEGNTVNLLVNRYFAYNGEQYVLLEEASEDDDCADCDCEECGHEAHTVNLYIMKVIYGKDEEGEDIEEFVQVDEALMDTLSKIVLAHYDEDEDDGDESEDEYAVDVSEDEE